ncbi:MAG TPA: HlyD family secretion protein [Acidimicrobiales bacterium]|nr:HlyD family secretion protein [Acidimicrobiales bacterium]
MAAGGAVLLLLGLLLVNAASDDPGAGAVEPRVVTAERRAFTATVPLAATVDVNPGASGTYLVTARVDPLVLYRLPPQPTAATVKIAGGPPEFACAAVALETVPAMPDNDDRSSDPSGEAFSVDEESGEVTPPRAPAGRQAQATAETVVRCLVPPDVRVFPGLRAELLVTTAQLPEAVVVPAGAVEPESAQTGFVTVVDDDDNEVRKPVKVGPSDGSLMVITEGLAAGDRVLDRVPIQESGARSEGGSRVLDR